MFEEMTIVEILKDLRSIKVPKKTREFLVETQSSLEKNGGIPLKTKLKIREIFNRYSIQVKELHAARNRARRTNGLRKMGLTRDKADELAQRRREAIKAMRSDVGF